ncbi:MAG: hypothetical protein ACKVLA_11270 [Rhodobacterales bacterium]
MPLPLEEHVRQVLLENDRGLKLFQAASDGWSAFDTGYPQRHQWRRKSTSRAMVWEEVVKRLVAVAADDQGITVIEHSDTLSLIVDDEVLVRLKHADTGLITRNVPTAEAQDFDNHDVDLYGFSGLQRVKLCYVLDQFESDLIWVGVSASNKGQFLWKIELNDVGAIAAPEMLPFVEAEMNTAKLAKLKSNEAVPGKKKKNDEK